MSFEEALDGADVFPVPLVEKDVHAPRFDRSWDDVPPKVIAADVAEQAGQGIGHIAKTILRLDRVAPGRRRMVLMKHRHRGEGEKVDLVLTDRGLEEA